MAQQSGSGLDSLNFYMSISHAHARTIYDSPEQVISLSQRPLPTQPTTNIAD
jgi:hypothetical protein